MRSHLYLLLATIVFGTCAAQASAATILKVGPNGQYSTISDAVAAADSDSNPRNYYVIKVTPGTYINDFPHVTRPMTIEVDPAQAGNAVVLQATEPLPNEKGIILDAASLTVKGLTFTGAQIDDSLGGNGAGIRDQNTGSPASLVVLNSTFTGNQEGILTGDDSGEAVTIVNSRFVNNGNPDGNGLEHALYVNHAERLTVVNSLFCGVLFGHDVKSRAQVTTVVNNKLYDGATSSAPGCDAGSTSYAVDVPNGGVATISGNQITQGAATQNERMVDYGEEGLTYSNNNLLLVGNSFVNSGVPNAIAIGDPPCVKAQLSRNNFQGVGTHISPSGCSTGQ